MDDVKQWNTCSCPFMRDAPCSGSTCANVIELLNSCFHSPFLKSPLNCFAGVQERKGSAAPCGDHGAAGDPIQNVPCVRSELRRLWPRAEEKLSQSSLL